MLVDPLVPRLLPCTLLAVPDWNEAAPLTEPPRTPTLIATARLCPAPPTLRHCMEVSDSHLDTSQLVQPSLATPQYVDSNSPAPCTVMLADPLDPAFLTRKSLALPTETDTPSVTLPTFPPTLIDSRCVDRPDRTI